MIAQPARALGTFNTVFQEALSALGRIYTQLKIIPKVISSSSAPNLKITKNKPPKITFKSVSFAYNKKNKVLDDINFVVNSGSKVALVGQSGSGKSTIINLISRFYDPINGEILINEENIENISLNSLRNNISLVSQETIIYNKSFMDNIRFGNLNAPDHKIKKAAMNADIHEFITNSLDGYNTVVGEGGNTLSGGQKQRISIARAILKDAPILLLDEATSSLDAETESEINRTLETLTKNKTTITIAHRLSTIINSDQIILLNKGKILDSGNHKELIKNSDYYKKLHNTST